MSTNGKTNASQNSSDLSSLERLNELTHGLWRKSVARQHDIEDRAIRAALNLPEEMGVNASRTTTINSHGLGWKEVLAIAALVGGGLMAYDWLTDDTPVAPPSEVVDTDTDTQYQIKPFSGA